MRVIFLDNLLRSLSWTFIHSLWQGLILTIVVGLVMLMTKRSVAALRYGLLCGLFFLFLGAVTLTFLIEWNGGGTKSPGLQLVANSSGINTLFHHSIFRRSVEQIAFFLDANSQWIVLAWLIVLGGKSVRMILDMIYVSRLRNHHTIAPGNEWKIRLQSLSYEMGIRKKVSLVESALTKIPIVVGHFKPVVLVPLGILTHLPPAEIEAVLLHELAHIRRHDYLVNFIQRITELLFFFNPGLLWVSSLLRIERENCCDDIAIARTNNKVQFVEALIRFKEHSLKQSMYALGLFGKRNLLLQRVTRIVYNRNKTLSPVEAVFFMMNVIGFIVLVSVTRQPGAREQAAPPPFVSHIAPRVSFSSEHIEDIQPVSKKKSPSVNNQVELSFAGDKSKSITEEIKEPLAEYLAMYKAYVERERDDAQLSYQLDQSRLQANKDREEADKYRAQAEQDRKQADKDREQAERDREQADKDRQQADRDREQAELDRHMADKDREQAELDRKRADKDREQIEKAGYRTTGYKQGL